MASTPSSSPPAADGRRERWRLHREARRAELIAAVLAAVAERGAGVGMDDIAAASGIAKPVYYRYFADKADLFRAVGRNVAEAIVGDVTAAIDAAEEPREKLAAGIDAYLRAVEAAPELYRFVAHNRLLDEPAAADPTAADPLGDYASVVGWHAARVIGDVMRAAGADSGGAEPWGFGLVGMVRSVADRWLEARSMSREALVGYLTDLVWPGLARAARRPADGRRAADRATADSAPGEDVQGSVVTGRFRQHRDLP